MLRMNAPVFTSQLRGINKISEEVAHKAVVDVKNRAPAWVSKGVRKIYGISASDMKGEVNIKISKKRIGKIKLTGNGA